MQWSDEPNSGFSTTKKPVLPVISGGPYGYERVNAAKQRRDVESLLNWTERIVRMRKVPEIGWGDFTIVETNDEGVLALCYEWRNNSVLLLHNLRDTQVQVELRMAGERGRELVNLFTENHSTGDRHGRHQIVLEPYGYRWYRVGGLDYLQLRTEF
jgi:maltose alpha-D-glucosyltransferase / alpha-amylase